MLDHKPLLTRCSQCNEIALIGEVGMVCPNGHGRIMQGNYYTMKKYYPERLIEHRPLRTRLAEFSKALKQLEKTPAPEPPPPPADRGWPYV